MQTPKRKQSLERIILNRWNLKKTANVLLSLCDHYAQDMPQGDKWGGQQLGKETDMS